jgi:hypothetical protein
MAGRLSTICAVLSVALLLYAVSVVLIGRQISRKLIHIEITKAVPPPAPPADGRINVLGVRVPLEVVWLVGVSGPTWLVSSMVWRQVTTPARAEREVLGLRSRAHRPAREVSGLPRLV